MSATAEERESASARDKRLAKLIGAELRQALLDVLTEEGEETQHPTDRVVYGAAPAPGADFVYSSREPTWPLSVFCRVVTSNAVANRNVAVEYRSGDGLRYVIAGANVTIPAMTTQAFCWHPEAGSAYWPVEDAAIAALPQQWLVSPSQLAITVFGGDVADQIDQVRLAIRTPPPA